VIASFKNKAFSALWRTGRSSRIDSRMLWLNIQRAYDLWHAEREMADEIAKIPTHRAA
jgi:hypothetical protein